MSTTAVRIRAAAIMPHQDNILLMHRLNRGQEYFVFPGGGVEENETIEHAVLREVLEETTINAEIEKLIYHHVYDNGSEQYYYLCRYVRGTPKLGEANESASMARGDDQFFEPAWYPISSISHMLLYPLEIRDWLIADLARGFPATPRSASYRIADLRQSL